MKTLDQILGGVKSITNTANPTSFRRRTTLSICAILLCGLSYSSALAESKALRLGFDETKISADPANSAFLYSDYSPLTLPSGLRLAVQTVTIPIQTAGETPTITVTTERGDWIGAIAPESFAQVDIPTADDRRYDEVRPAIAELFENGFSGAFLEAIRPSANGAVAQLTISPYEIDSAGNVYAVKGITLSVDAATQVIIGEPQYGAASSSPFSSPSASPLLGSSATSMNYIIVTNKTLEPEMQRLADYKNATGVSTHVELIEDILATYTGVDDAEALRNALKDYFELGVTHVMLAGDENVVPIRHTYYYNTNTMPLVENMMVTDLYFADLTGDWDTDGDGIWGEPTQDNPDLTPELHIGRLPISRIDQAKNYVDKLIVYETNPGFGDATYLGKTVIYSSDQMRDFSNGGQHAIIANAIPDYYYVDTSSTIEFPSGSSTTPNNESAANTITTLDQGYGVINIIAHGRHDGFSVRTTGYNAWPKSYLLSEGANGTHGSLDQLAPNGKIGLYVALSCDLGGFDMDAPPFVATSPSFVESVVSTELSGAVGMVGYSRWGWVYSSYRLHESFWGHLYGDAEGDVVVAMNMAAADFPYYRDLIYGQNYYGDPTVQIHLDIPQEVALTVSAGDWAQNTIEVSVSSKGSASRGAAIAGAKVILSADGVVLAESVTDAAGNANFVYEFLLGVDYLVATHPTGALVQLTQFTPSIVTGVDDDEQSVLPQAFSLQQNYPNPFHPSTTIEWDLPRSSDVSYRVIDILGRTVTQANLGRLPAGRHSLNWEAQNINGAALASGVYFFQLVTEENIASRKMTLLK